MVTSLLGEVGASRETSLTPAHFNGVRVRLAQDAAICSRTKRPRQVQKADAVRVSTGEVLSLVFGSVFSTAPGRTGGRGVRAHTEAAMPGRLEDVGVVKTDFGRLGAVQASVTPSGREVV